METFCVKYCSYLGLVVLLTMPKCTLFYPIISIGIYWLLNLAVSGLEWERQSQVSLAFCLTKQSYLPSIEKLNPGRAAVPPCDWKSLHKKNKYSLWLGNWPMRNCCPSAWLCNWLRKRICSWFWLAQEERVFLRSWVSLQTDKSRCQPSTQLQSPSFLRQTYTYNTMSQLSPGNIIYCMMEPLL